MSLEDPPTRPDIPIDELARDFPFIITAYPVTGGRPPEIRRQTRLWLAIGQGLLRAFDPAMRGVNVTDDYGTLWAQFGALWQCPKEKS